MAGRNSGCSFYLASFWRYHVAIVWFLLFSLATDAWEPTWESLDRRPLPSWYEDAKLGIFIHWGLFAVPSFGSEWFWEWSTKPEYQKFLHQTENMNTWSYPNYASEFHATFYRPEDWAEIFAKSGARYVVLTSKHHEGYCMWNSTNIPSTWNWNAMDIGPKRDLLGELSRAVKATSLRYSTSDDDSEQSSEQFLKFGVYHSLFEWFNPLYLTDKHTNNLETDHFVRLKILPELYDLVERYEPELIWSDGDWEAPSTYWKSTEFLSWYATESPVAETAVWNDRWGSDGTTCVHGSYWTCSDRYHPETMPNHKWESAVTLDKTSWGWNRNATWNDYMTVGEVVQMLVETVALGGNLLLNVGPTADGIIPIIFVDRMYGLGDWLQVNGEAIYETRPRSLTQMEVDTTSTDEDEEGVAVYYTTRKNKSNNDLIVYAIFTSWPKNNELVLQNVTSTADLQIRFVGTDFADLVWEDNENNDGELSGIRITLPLMTPNVVPCQHAWALALTGLSPDEEGMTASS